MGKNNKMFYYKHHIGDYRRDTGHLSLLEHGAYRQLLDLYYVDEKPIPNETDWVMRRLSAKTQVEKDAVLAVLSDFFTQNSEGWSHKRCDAEILVYEEKADQNQKNGKLGGRPKKKAEINPEITQSVSNANPTQSENNLNHKPLTINHKPLTKDKKVAPLCVAVSVLVEKGFDEATAAEFIAHKTKMKAPLTARAWADHLSESAKAGWTPKAAAEKVMAKSWKGFEAKYVASEAKPSAYNPPSPAITIPAREAVDPIMSRAIIESTRTFKPVTEIYARMKNERIAA